MTKPNSLKALLKEFRKEFESGVFGRLCGSCWEINRTDLEAFLTKAYHQGGADKAKEIEALKDALIWCSGSEDFQEGGKARKGWLKVKQLLTPKEDHAQN